MLGVPQIFKETDEGVTVVPFEQVQQRIVEHVPVPQILEETDEMECCLGHRGGAVSKNVIAVVATFEHDQF